MAIPDRIRVLVSHHDPLWQAGVIATLGQHGDIDVIEARKAPEDCTSPPDADVVVTDYQRGVDLAASAGASRGFRHGVRVIVVATSDRECEIRAALACGVHGYLLAGCAPDELASAVRAVGRGERSLSLKVATRLADNLASDPLTSREEDVLRLLVEGLCNKAIAGRLKIEVGTVKSHLRALFGKLRVGSRMQAAALAERRGLLVAVSRPSRFESGSGAPRTSPGWARGRHEGTGPAALP